MYGDNTLACVTPLSTEPTGEEGIITLNPDETITLMRVETPEFQEDKIEVEPLTEAEWKELSAARKKLQEVQDKIRSSHGEFRRHTDCTGGWCIETTECRGSETTVEIRGKQVLKTTRYANGGCF